MEGKVLGHVVTVTVEAAIVIGEGYVIGGRWW
jgi:hypothetical protein